MSNSQFPIDSIMVWSTQSHLERTLEGEGEIWGIIDVSELEIIPTAGVHAGIGVVAADLPIEQFIQTFHQVIEDSSICLTDLNLYLLKSISKKSDSKEMEVREDVVCGEYVVLDWACVLES